MKGLYCALLVLSVSFPAVSATPPLSFRRPIQSAISNEALSGAASADLNLDGTADLITAAGGSGTVFVSISRGDGSFDAPRAYAIAPGRGHLAVGDFNNDSLADIVVAAAGIAVLPGSGDGTLQPPIVSPGSAGFVVVADFNGDGNQDLASVGRNSTSSIPETVDVYAGNGDGTFGAPVTLATSDNHPAALAVGDFNGDGLPDLAFGLRDIRSLQVYLNSGGLTFVNYGGALIDVGPSRTAVADLDDNGTADIVTADFVGTISVFFGNGDGTIQPARSYPVGDAACGSPATCPAPQWLALGDFNRDGFVDAAAATEQPGGAAVLLNDGTGSFGSAMTLDAETHAYAAIPADFDNDGALDLGITSGAAGFLEPGARTVTTYLSRLRANHGSSRGK